MLVIHGANDPRVPVEEAEQIVAALKKRMVPVEYLRYEDEGHGLAKLKNRPIPPEYGAVGQTPLVLDVTAEHKSYKLELRRKPGG